MLFSPTAIRESDVVLNYVIAITIFVD